MESWPIKQWYTLIIGLAVALGFLVSAPHFLHTLDERYQGIPTHFNADEYSYLPRVQEVLERGPGYLGVAIAGGEVTPPLQAGLIEKIYGVVFSPFFSQAHQILTLMDFVMPLLLFLVLIGFLRAMGLSRKQALVIAILFCVLELYNLGRPIHQRTSFILLLLSLWGLIAGLEKRIMWGIIGGALMGVLIGVYFWAWTAAWAWWGIMALAMLYAHRRNIYKWLFFGGVGLITGLPFLHHMYLLKDQPLYEEVFFRTGVGTSHVPESWPWTILFLAMAVGAWQWWRRGGSIYVSVTIITAFLLLNQHVVHGVLFLYASHYLFYLVLAACIALVTFWRGKVLNLTVIAAIIFLGGIATDNLSVFAQWRIDEVDFEEQHLAGSLPVLHSLDRGVVLSSPLGSAFVASHTKHDVLFTYYLQHEFKSHQEVIERYIMTQILKPPHLCDVKAEPVLIYGAAYDALYTPAEKEALRTQELKLAKVTHQVMEDSPADYFDKYQVEYVLWDELREPEWHDPGVMFEKIAAGEGWSIWQRKI